MIIVTYQCNNIIIKQKSRPTTRRIQDGYDPVLGSAEPFCWLCSKYATLPDSEWPEGEHCLKGPKAHQPRIFYWDDDKYRRDEAYKGQYEDLTKHGMKHFDVLFPVFTRVQKLEVWKRWRRNEPGGENEEDGNGGLFLPLRAEMPITLQEFQAGLDEAEITRFAGGRGGGRG